MTSPSCIITLKAVTRMMIDVLSLMFHVAVAEREPEAKITATCHDVRLNPIVDKSRMYLQSCRWLVLSDELTA